VPWPHVAEWQGPISPAGRCCLCYAMASQGTTFHTDAVTLQTLGQAVLGGLCLWKVCICGVAVVVMVSVHRAFKRCAVVGGDGHGGCGDSALCGSICGLLLLVPAPGRLTASVGRVSAVARNEDRCRHANDSCMQAQARPIVVSMRSLSAAQPAALAASTLRMSRCVGRVTLHAWHPRTRLPHLLLPAPMPVPAAGIPD